MQQPMERISWANYRVVLGITIMAVVGVIMIITDGEKSMVLCAGPTMIVIGSIKDCIVRITNWISVPQ